MSQRKPLFRGNPTPETFSRILIRFIDSIEQRYETQGDWWIKDGALEVRSRWNDGEAFTDEVFLVALHELVEAYLCWRRGISPAEVDSHDFMFEAERSLGQHGEEAEAGDDPRAPYRREHRFAMLLEMLMANELGQVDYGTVR